MLPVDIFLSNGDLSHKINHFDIQFDIFQWNRSKKVIEHVDQTTFDIFKPSNFVTKGHDFEKVVCMQNAGLNQTDNIYSTAYLVSL